LEGTGELTCLQSELDEVLREGGGTASRDQRSQNAAGTGIRRCGGGPPIFYRLAFKSRPPGGLKPSPTKRNASMT